MGERIEYNFLPASVKPRGPDKESRILLSAEIKVCPGRKL
jgi:hypothetical protein